jgi:hypothetical protein
MYSIGDYLIFSEDFLKHLTQSKKIGRKANASGKILKGSIKNRISVMKMDYFVGMA